MLTRIQVVDALKCGHTTINPHWDASTAYISTMADAIMGAQIAALKASGGEPPAPNSASLAIALLERVARQLADGDALDELELRGEIVTFLAAQRQA